MRVVVEDSLDYLLVGADISVLGGFPNVQHAKDQHLDVLVAVRHQGMV